MPEGDTIFRTAASLQRWIGGREVTAARSTHPGLDPSRLVGRRVEAVEAQGKHLLIRCSGGLVVHSHMRMSGSWHVYPTGERWRRPPRQARLVIETGARLAVCFNAPVIELLSDAEERSHRSLARLGPDVLRPDTLDPAVVHERARSRAEASPTIGELLLDQQVVAGIGNIYRCEALFACRTNPRLASADVDDALLDRLVATASRLMVANARTASWSRSFDGAADQPWVYGRRDQPCRRCATPIAREILGHQARSVYWCPGCQPAPDRPVANGRPAAPAGR